MKKIHEWELWDWRSIILTPLVIAALFFIFYSMETIIPDNLRSLHSKKYSRTTYANFIKWHRKTYISQDRSGSVETTLGFEVTYSYVVYDHKFIETDLVPDTDNYQKFLGKLESNEISIFLIKYDPKAPANSQIVADNKYYKNK